LTLLLFDWASLWVFVLIHPITSGNTLKHGHSKPIRGPKNTQHTGTGVLPLSRFLIF
jgi:hypothetical protein